MRSCVLALAVAACTSDPVLHVVVTHPSGLAVASTTVSIYESKAFACQDIEYGDVDPSALEAALVASETIDATGSTGTLTGISRTDPKHVVARGFDASGNLVAAGCAEQGTVSGDTTLTVSTEVAAVVSVASAAAAGGTDIYGIKATVTDASGNTIDGRQVWWRVYGPAGTSPDARASGVTTITDGVWQSDQPTCTSEGLATIHAVPPATIGGFAVAVRVAWAAAPPQLFSAFTRFPSALAPISPPVANASYCTRHVLASGPRLTCLAKPASTIVAFDLAVTESDGMTSSSIAQMAAAPSNAVAVYGLDNGAQRDVYIATSDCAVAGVFGSTPTDTSAQCAATPTADDVLVVPACGTLPAKLLFHVAGGAGTDSVVMAGATGGGGSAFPLGYSGAERNVAFNSAGCVTLLRPGQTPTMVQMIVLQYANVLTVSATRAHVWDGSAWQTFDLPIPGTGAAFVGGSESRVIVPSVDASGLVLSQDVLLEAANKTEQFVERSREPAGAVPDHFVVGNFDADDGPDLLWSSNARRGATTSFELAYARQVDGEPLEALSPAVPVTIDQMLVGDVTGDGYDDIVLMGQTGTTPGVGIIPTRVAPAQVPLNTDTPCAP